MRVFHVLVARVGNLAARPRRLATLVTRLHARLLRLSRGRLRRSLFLAGGQPVLVLTTRGRKTGRPRSTPVAYFRDGTSFVISAANAGLDRPPAWWLNLQARPDTTVEVPGERRAVRARAATGEERDRLWAKFRDYPGWGDDIDGLATRRSSETAVVVLEPR
jgi:deazaflavin-dependent oxidoreductase (nitroreductase family)